MKIVYQVGINKGTVRQVGYLPELYEDARSEKHKTYLKCFHRRYTQNLLHNLSKANSFRLQVKLRTSRQSGRTKSHNSYVGDMVFIDRNSSILLLVWVRRFSSLMRQNCCYNLFRLYMKVCIYYLYILFILEV